VTSVGVARHAELYAQEYGWGENFEGICAHDRRRLCQQVRSATRTLLIAEMERQNVGCVFLSRYRDGRAAAPLLAIRWRAGAGLAPS